MEVIKKTILRAVKTGTTLVPCTFRDPQTGKLYSCTGTCRTIIPDTGVTYNIKILLTQNTQDIGFFDAYEVVSGLTGTTIHNPSYTVTGASPSRLSELKKFAVNVPFNQQYIGNGSYTVDGVDFVNSVSGVSVIYYLGGIRYVDNVISGTTTFRFIGQGWLNPNFINVPYYKDPDKENIISYPKITDDVFIVRQELSAFEGNFRLEQIRNLNDLETYAGGKFFTIIKNS